MAIQMRRGYAADYDESKMLPGEFGVSVDNEELYISFATGNSKRVLTEADEDSPEFSGVPTAPTAPTGTDTTQIATAGFVQQELTPVKTGFAQLRAAIANINTELSDEVKAALLVCFSHVAWVDEYGQDYYDALEDALYSEEISNIILSDYSIAMNALSSTHQLTAITVPSGRAVTWTSSDNSVATVSSTGLVTSVGYGSATITASSGDKSATCSVLISQITVTSIEAAYTQNRIVYEDSTLDSLKSDLIVAATWANETTTVVNSADYSLSGTLSAGTSIITVSYGGKTATFSVLVTSSAGFSTLTLNDFIDTRGFSDFSVSNGTTVYTGAAQFSVAAVDVGISSVTADTSPTTNPRGTWLIFCKVNSDKYYITDGGTNPKLFIFTYDSTNQKFTSVEDNTIAVIEKGEGYNYSPAKTKIDLVDNELLLYDVETNKLIYKITNANCLGFWAHAYYGVPVWSNVKVKYDMRIPVLSDFVETRTVPELQIASSGTVTCGSAKSYWLFALKSGITSIKYYHTGSVSSKLAAWIVYKKVDANTYYCTDGLNRFSFEYDSTNNKFTATNINDQTEIQILYGGDKSSTYLAGGMYVTAQLENNSLRVLSSYGYSFIIPDANCLGFWGMSANTLASFRVGGDVS